MIAHPSNPRMIILHPNLYLTQLLKRPRGNENGDPLKMIRQHAQGLLPLLRMLSIYQSGFHMNPPALDL
jgi:hypothetical protein